jgi:hypothetical protein
VASSICSTLSIVSLTMIPHLTHDVVETIFDHIDATSNPHYPLCSYDFDENDRRKSKLKGIAPFWSWVSPARRVLYRAIPDLPVISFKNFFRTVQETPDIRSFVRWMYISSDPHRDIRITMVEYLPLCLLILTDSAWHANPAKNLLPHLSALGGIVLRSAPWGPEQWMVAIRHWTNLQSLELSFGGFLFPTQEFADAAHREHVLPALKMLTLDDGYLHNCAADLITPPSTPNTLHTLSISCRTDTADNIPNFSGLLVRHSESLRCLRLFSVQFSEHVRPIFDDLGSMLPRLESLLISGTRYFRVPSSPTFPHLSLTLPSAFSILTAMGLWKISPPAASHSYAATPTVNSASLDSRCRKSSGVKLLKIIWGIGRS